MSSPLNPALADAFLSKFESKEHLKNWIYTYLGWDLPDSYIDEESNSSPIDWMWAGYSMYKNNTCNKSPSIITISARGGFKTLTQSIFAVIIMLHFNASYCHGAAIIPQAQVAQEYVSKFLTQLQPYMEHHNLYLLTDNSKDIKIGPKGAKIPAASMKILVLNMAGSNAAHSNLLCVDELDLLRSAEQRKAFNEIQKVPAEFNGQFPLTIKTSTLKFRSGLFSQQLDLAKEKGWQIHKWNLLDITQKCPPERHGERTTETVYARYELPLKSISEVEYNRLLPNEQEGYSKLDNVRAGCLKCPLLSVCKGKLAERSSRDQGPFWKSIDFTISEMETTDPDMAMAQLLCRRAAASGMVYPRFDDRLDGTGNIYTVEQAWETYTGEKAPPKVTYHDLLQKMIKSGIKFYVGGDWGHTGAQAFVVSAKMPNGEFWIMDSYSVPGLEWEQVLDLGIRIRDLYNRPAKWFMDTNAPMFTKAFNKNGMSCAKFTKDVFGGISAIRGQIIDAKGRRRLKVIKHERNEVILKMFKEHAFKLDTMGNPTQEPDDSSVSHIGDSTRYIGQNLFKPKGNLAINVHKDDLSLQPQLDRNYETWFQQKIDSLKDDNLDSSGMSDSGTVFWDFSGDAPLEDE